MKFAVKDRPPAARDVVATFRLPPAVPRPALVLRNKVAGDPRYFLGLEYGHRVRRTLMGRYALYQFLSELGAAGKRKILIPAFHCPTIVDPVISAGYAPIFYPVQPDLTIDLREFRCRVEQDTAACIVVRYFGFPCGMDEVIKECKSLGILTIDDWAHSFLQVAPLRLSKSDADVMLYSFKKIVPTICGGGLLTRSEERQREKLMRVPGSVHLKIMKQLADGVVMSAGSRRSPELGVPRLDSEPVRRALESSRPAVRRAASEAYPYLHSLERVGMPWLSSLLLNRADLADVAWKRRRNYRCLADQLRSWPHCWPLFAHLPENVCPWGFPLVMQDRQQHDHKLRTLGVPLFTFGEVLHPLILAQASRNSAICSAAQWLSGNLLVLAIHQDLSEEQMRRTAMVVNDYAVASAGAASMSM